MGNPENCGLREPTGVAVLGLGTAGAMMLAAARAHPSVDLVAVADSRAKEMPLSGLPGSVRVYDGLQGLLDDDRVEVVHIATPTPLHLEHAAAVLASGRHVIVEKPMEADLGRARELAALATTSSGVLVVGHSASYEPYVQAAASIVASGEIGPVVSIVATKYTNWLRRSRFAEELDFAKGGGLVRRQGVHQIDSVRTILGGGELRVREAQLRRDRGRDAVGSYLAWLIADRPDQETSIVVCHDGVGATIGEPGSVGPGSSPLLTPSGEEEQSKRVHSDRRLVRAITADLDGVGEKERGEIVVLGVDGEIVSSPRGVRVSTNAGSHDVDLSTYEEGRAAVLTELLATVGGAPPRHDGAWGCENIRICEEIESCAAPVM
jgi:phthalate 4,5-cis-dihydrodiol dehydrogenase